LYRANFDKRIVAAGFYLSLAGLAVITLVSYWGTIRLIQDSESAIHAHDLQANLHNLLSLLGEAESAQRGYIITGDKRFLEPYYLAGKDIDRIINKLDSLIAENSSHQEKFKNAKVLIFKKMALLQERISLIEKGGREAAIQSVKSTVGLELMEKIRDQLLGIVKEEHEMLKLRSEKLKTSNRRSLIIAPIGAIISFIILMAFYLLKKEIARRRQVEESLRKSEQEAKTIINNIPAIVFKGYPDWTINLINDNIDKILGYKKEEFDSLHLKWSDLVEEEDILPLKKVFIKALKGKKAYVREYRVKNKKGGISWIQERSQIICKEDGRIDYISGIFFDISELKDAEKAIGQLRQKIGMILDAAWEGIFGLDLNGDHTFVNPAAARMLGYEVEELIGKHSHSTWHYLKPDGSPYPQEECPIYETFRKGTSHHVRNEVFWRKDGTSFQVAYSGSPIVEDGKIVGAVVTFWDISERKRAEAEREKLINELQDALAQVRTLKGFLPICAHCKKIRDDEGYWQQIERYILDRSEAEFSHGICPDCAKEHYPDFYKDDNDKGKDK
jgi:PAS domain S-box-containing protein